MYEDEDAPYLFSLLYPPGGADDDLVSSLKRHHFSHTVGGTRVVDVSAEAFHKDRKDFIENPVKII